MPLKKQHEHGRNPRPLGRGGCQYDDAPYQGALFQSLADQVGY